jgi:hypothetical protein
MGHDEITNFSIAMLAVPSRLRRLTARNVAEINGEVRAALTDVGSSGKLPDSVGQRADYANEIADAGITSPAISQGKAAELLNVHRAIVVSGKRVSKDSAKPPAGCNHTSTK